MTERGKQIAGASARKSGRVGWSRALEKRFVAELERSLNPVGAAQLVDRPLSFLHDRQQRDPRFAEAWRRALERGYGELEFTMLRQAIRGAERTEMVHDCASGEVRQRKSVHSFPHVMALRLLQAHRADRAVRQAEAGTEGAAKGHGIDATKARMDQLRERYEGAVLIVDQELAQDGDEDGQA